VVAGPPTDLAEVDQCTGLAGPVTELAEDGKGLLEMVGGQCVTAQPVVGDSEVVQGAGFGRRSPMCRAAR